MGQVRGLALQMALSTSALVMLVAACGGAPATIAPADEPAGPAPEETSADEQTVSAASIGQFSKAASMVNVRTTHKAVLLPNGRVMIVGGRNKERTYRGPLRHDSVEIYDPATEEWSESGNMTKRREEFTTDLLPDGRVLSTGGRDQQRYHRQTELWDPATDEWTKGPNMASARWIHRSVRLADARVMVVGGTNDYFALVAGAEIFDPETDTFSASGAMAEKRAEHTATLLNDGRVLVAGGGKGGVGTEGTKLDTAEIWDPETGEWSSAGTMTEGRAKHTATKLLDGRVLMTGSQGQNATAEIYDPATDSWTAAGTFSEWRALHRAALLSDGRVLVSGGLGDVSTTDLFDPSTGTWSPGPLMGTPRYDHTATVMEDGRVLIVGGNTTDSGGDPTITNRAEIYTP